MCFIFILKGLEISNKYKDEIANDGRSFTTVKVQTPMAKVKQRSNVGKNAVLGSQHKTTIQFTLVNHKSSGG